MDQVEQLFTNWIKTRFKEKESIRHFLLNHERKNLVLDNIRAEIRRAELFRRRFSAAERKLIIETVAQSFSAAAIKHKEEQLLSQAARMALLAEAGRLKRAEEIASECIKEVD